MTAAAVIHNRFGFALRLCSLRFPGGLPKSATNQSGAFSAKGVEPGTYYALAYEPDESQHFSDAAILKQLVDKGTKVEVKENDEQRLPLTLLPAEQLQAALTAAGVDN